MSEMKAMLQDLGQVEVVRSCLLFCRAVLMESSPFQSEEAPLPCACVPLGQLFGILSHDIYTVGMVLPALS